MADYNIYIHSDQASSSGNKTEAWKFDGQASEGGETSSWVSKFQSGVNTAMNPDSLIDRGVGFLAKAVPAVAVAMIAFKVIDSAVTTANQFVSTESGDYRSTTYYNNFKSGFTMLFRPFSTAFNVAKVRQQERVENKARQEFRYLYGDSTINSYNKYGV